MTLAITVGEGANRPQGRMVKLEAASVEAIAAAVYDIPSAVETWWSPHLWRDNRRAQAAWLATSAIALDVDYGEDGPPPDEARAHLVALARGGQLPGSFFHLTPHGARVVFQFAAACSDRQAVLDAAAAAQELVGAAIAGTGYRVDPAPTKDLARLFYAPRAFAKGVQRDAEVIVMRREFYAPAELAAALPKPAQEPPPPAVASSTRSPSIAEAIARFNREHPLDLPRHSDRCPACGHDGCFGRLPEDDQRWHCFSTAHPDGVGIRGAQGYHGDALDLFAHENGVKPIDVLRKMGYLAAPRAAAPPAPAAAVDDSGADVTPIDRGRRVYRNNSYLTCVQIIETNDRDVLGRGARLEWDEMAGRATINRRPLEDVDELRVRAEIERRFTGGVDGNGEQKGLKQSLSDVRAAMAHVARERPFHPVREYLTSLQWDGTPRLDSVAEDILGAERTVLNQALVRRFMVSAVARALRPGCKVDTALILVGRQGVGKSSFFSVLAGEWFVDTALDITTAKAFMTLRRAWLYEWAELEVIRRAKDINAVKSFITSRVDSYVPQYGHNPVDVPRSFVVVGSTNTDEFLVDDENRRFWPLRVGTVDVAALRAQRDQLLAEAVSIFAAWERAGANPLTTPWVLSEEEARLLAEVHAEHQSTDAWESLVLPWASKQIVEFTTADILTGPLDKPRGQWNRGDEMRVASILKRNGWRTGNKPEKGGRPWVRK